MCALRLLKPEWLVLEEPVALWENFNPADGVFINLLRDWYQLPCERSFRLLQVRAAALRPRSVVKPLSQTGTGHPEPVRQVHLRREEERTGDSLRTLSAGGPDSLHGGEQGTPRPGRVPPAGVALQLGFPAFRTRCPQNLSQV